MVHISALVLTASLVHGPLPVADSCAAAAATAGGRVLRGDVSMSSRSTYDAGMFQMEVELRRYDDFAIVQSGGAEASRQLESVGRPGGR